MANPVEYWATAAGSYMAVDPEGVTRRYGFSYPTYPRASKKAIVGSDGVATIEVSALRILGADQFAVVVYADDGWATTATRGFFVNPVLPTLPAPTDLAVKSGTLSSSGFTIEWTGVNAVDPGDYVASARPADGSGPSVMGELVKGKTEAVFSDLPVVASYMVSVYATNGDTLRHRDSGRAGTLDVTMPTLSISPTRAVVIEGASGNTPQTLTVALSPASSESVRVAYATADGTATAGSDYLAANDTLTFDIGDTSKTITIQITGDAMPESTESFTVALSPAAGETTYISPTERTSTITITDDDGEPLPTLSIADARADEGNSTSTNMIFTVTLSETSSEEVTVAYATADASASAGTDYTATSGILTIAASTTTQTITVSITGDVTYEPDESFTVTLSGP